MLVKWHIAGKMGNACFVFCLFISFVRCFLLEQDDGFDAPETINNAPGGREDSLGQIAVENEQVHISSKVQETVSSRSVYKMKFCSA